METILWTQMEEDKNNKVDFELWKDRARLMGSLVSADIKSVLDVGCGESVVKQFLPHNLIYVGVDYCKREHTSYIADFNKYEFPDIVCDAVIAGGILEHIIDYKWFLDRICLAANKEILISYTVEHRNDKNEKRRHIQNGYQIDWVNSLEIADIVEIFEKNHFSLVLKEKVGMADCVMKFIRDNA